MSEESRPNKISPLAVHLARYLPMLIIGGLAVHLLLPQLANLQHSLQVLQTMLWWAAGLAIVAQIMSYVCSGVLLHTIIDMTGEDVPLFQAILIPMSSGSIGLVAGGIVGVIAATYRWLRRYQVDADGALLAGWLPIQLENAIITGLAILGLAHLLLTHALTTWQVMGYSLVLLALLLIVVTMIWALAHRAQVIHLAQRVAGKWATWRHKAHDPYAIRASVEEVFKTWDVMRAGGWRRPALAALFNIGFDMLTLYFIFLAARYPVSVGVLLTGYGLPLLLGKVSFLPGGVGIVEATMTALYTGLGVPVAVTVVVILIYRFLTFWLPATLGFLIIPYLNHLSGRADESKLITR